MTSAELRDRWFSVLKAGARKMLAHLLTTYPLWISRTALAEDAELEQSGGTFGTYLSMLRRNGLIEEDHDLVRAAEVFFLAKEQT